MRTAAALAGLALAAAVPSITGCAGTTAPRPDRARLPATSAPAAPSLGAPAEELPGTRTLLYQPPVHGARLVGRADVRSDVPVWISVTCSAPADTDIRVEFQPLDQFHIPCGSEASATRNQVNLRSPRTLTLAVTAPESVTWSIRVQQ